MIFEKLFTQSNILEAAMQATQYKNDIIMDNITNANTPNYKRKSVSFEGVLDDAIEKTRATGKNYMNGVMKDIKVSTKESSTMHDKNSVDIETEMIELYKNSTKYDVVVNSINSNSNLKSIIYQTLK